MVVRSIPSLLYCGLSGVAVPRSCTHRTGQSSILLRRYLEKNFAKSFKGAVQFKHSAVNLRISDTSCGYAPLNLLHNNSMLVIPYALKALMRTIRAKAGIVVRFKAIFYQAQQCSARTWGSLTVHLFTVRKSQFSTVFSKVQCDSLS